METNDLKEAMKYFLLWQRYCESIDFGILRIYQDMEILKIWISLKIPSNLKNYLHKVTISYKNKNVCYINLFHFIFSYLKYVPFLLNTRYIFCSGRADADWQE